jgi:hypothetical protein
MTLRDVSIIVEAGLALKTFCRLFEMGGTRKLRGCPVDE